MADITRFELLKALHRNAFVFQRGIERETLRVTKQGQLSQTPHPESLGSALTHTSITTDYSESLMEFITGVHSDKNELIAELDELHRYTYSALADEYLWANSMPSPLPEQEQIPIAQFGNSHIGRLKTIYRHGLWHRYGRKMQTIAGLHYNWSLGEEFWQQWATLNGKTGDLTPFKTEEYFGLIRSFRRHSWLLLYLFGASPAADRSFLDEDTDVLKNWGDSTLYGPYATSLRMSDLGYSNKAQSELFVCFNSLESYAKTLHESIERPYPAYEAIGLKDGIQYKQLNTNILQIENEYYSDIRPKRVVYSGEKPLHALRYRGVEYIEVRCLDVNPFLPLGIDEKQIDFMDLFLLWCLVQDNPLITSKECQQLQHNSKQVAIRGRDPSLTLLYNGKERLLTELATELIESICQFGKLIDEKSKSNCYQQACSVQKEKIANPEALPSNQVMAAIKDSQTFHQFALDRSRKTAKYFSENISDKRLKFRRKESTLSWQRQRDIEVNDKGTFEAFLADYLKQ